MIGLILLILLTTSNLISILMKVFNAIQIALLVAAGPMLLSLLKGASFAYAQPLFWLCGIIYAILFCWNAVMIVESLEK
jgi:hypothetical protein